MSKAKPVDITMIGAGPTGLFGAFYAGMREMSIRLVDALEGAGGQITAMYPDKFIYDAPGFPKVRGSELVENLVQQADQYDPDWRLGCRIAGLERDSNNDLWILTTDEGEELPSRTVVVSAGIGAFEPRKLRTVDTDAYEGRGLVYFAKDFSKFEGANLLIVGGGDSAVDWALNLEPYVNSLTLIHRRDGFRAHSSSVSQMMENPRIDVRVFHELREIRGDKVLDGAVIFDNRDDSETVLDIDRMILALGFKADLGPIKEWGLELDGRQRRIQVNSRMETNLPGVFAAGDIIEQSDVEQLNLIVCGFSQATLAVNYAYVHLNPDARLFPGHSSERD